MSYHLPFFKNRPEAGDQLAQRLIRYQRDSKAVVLALPRGGVPVGYEVAMELGLPLDVFVVRKLGFPGHQELAMGAVASGGVRVLTKEIVDLYGVSASTLESITEAETVELVRRELAYRRGEPPREVAGQTVILVDDGLATGSTMLAAIRALRKRRPARLIAAVPVAALAAVELLSSEADEVVSVETPKPFYSVGQWYEDFTQTTDADVRFYLKQARRRTAA